MQLDCNWPLPVSVRCFFYRGRLSLIKVFMRYVGLIDLILVNYISSGKLDYVPLGVLCRQSALDVHSATQ